MDIPLLLYLIKKINKMQQICNEIREVRRNKASSVHSGLDAIKKHLRIELEKERKLRKGKK